MASLPSLPPELLLPIFKYLQPFSNTLPLDILSCSLVCVAWNAVAGTLIPSHILSHLLRRQTYTPADLTRLQQLLLTSRVLGLDYTRRIRIVSVNLNTLFTRIPEFEAALLSLIASFPHIHGIDLVLTYPDPPLPTGLLANIPAACRMTYLGIFCDRITHLPNATQQTLAQLITDCAPTLRELKTDIGFVDRTILTAFSLCTDMRTASFQYSTVLAARLLPQWPRLSSLTIERFRYTNDLESILPRLPSTLRRLRVLSVWSEAPPRDALRNLASRCTRLMHLTLIDEIGVDDVFLGILATMVRGLRRLDLRGCQGVTGRDVEVRWNELRYVDLRKCRWVAPVFVEELAKRCAKLSVLRVSEAIGGMDRVAAVLAECGFRFDGWSKWCRVVEVGTGEERMELEDVESDVDETGYWVNDSDVD